MRNHHIHSTCHRTSAIESSKFADFTFHLTEERGDGQDIQNMQENKTFVWKISREQAMGYGFDLNTTLEV
jgi:hypothetical protein